jgi:hypothetical protein
MKTSEASVSPTGRVSTSVPEFQDLPGSFGAMLESAKLKHGRESMQGIAAHALDYSAVEARIPQRPHD